MSINIQDVSAGSAMWRLFAGINQRRGALWRKVYRYEGTSFVSVDTFEDARIVPGANLQHYYFWQFLQLLVLELYLPTVNNAANRWINAPADGSLFSYEPVSYLTGNQPPVFRAYYGSGSLREASETDPYCLLQVDDIIGSWLVEDMLSLLAPLRWMLLFSEDWQGDSGTTLETATSPNSVFREDCASVYNRALDFYKSSSFAPGHFEEYVSATGSGREDGYTSFVASSQRATGSPYTYRDGLPASCRTLHHAVRRETSVNYAIVDPTGYVTVNTSDGDSISIDASKRTFDINAENPLQQFGIDCSTVPRPAFGEGTQTVAHRLTANHHIIVHGKWSDLDQ